MKKIILYIIMVALSSCWGALSGNQIRRGSCLDEINEMYATAYTSIESIDTIEWGNPPPVLLVKVHEKLNIRGVFLLQIGGEEYDSCIRKSFYIDMNWDDSGFDEKHQLLDDNTIGLEDVNGDGKEDLYIQRRAHNGTVYNAAVKYYFSFNQEGELVHLVNIESKTVYPFEDFIIIRQVVSNTVFVSLERIGFSDKSPLGKFTLKWTGGKAMAVDEEISDSLFTNLLITGSGKPIDLFLNPYSE